MLWTMDYRQLGRSGLRVSALTLGTMTFGGRGSMADVGSTDVAGARRQLDICLDAGVNLIDTADVYSAGLSEEILGEALEGRRDRLLLATKARMPMGDGPNDAGLSRQHLIASCEASLRRLNVDHIDLYQVHEWDGHTPLEETLHALDTLVRDGKVRYVGASNYAGWQLMKALATADAHGYQRFVSQQIHYTLQARDAEYELVPLGLDQGVGILVWSPLAGGLLSGKHRRDRESPAGTRALSDWDEPPVRRPRGAPRHRRRAGGDRRGPRRVRGPGGAGLAARPAGRELGGDRRAHGRAAGRQPRRGRPRAERGRARPARRGQRAAAAVSVLASAQDGERPPQRRRSGAAGRPRVQRELMRRNFGRGH